MTTQDPLKALLVGCGNMGRSQTRIMKEHREFGLVGVCDSVRTGASHPLAGEVALRGFEVVMAIYESARTRCMIRMPLQQDQFPLAVMIEES